MVQAQTHPDLNAANAPGASIGRGFGSTIKELRRQINAYLKRKKIPSYQWRTLAQKQAAQGHLTLALSPKGGEGEEMARRHRPAKPDFQSARQHVIETGVRKFSQKGNTEYSTFNSDNSRAGIQH